MQLATGTVPSVSTANFAMPETTASQESRYAQYRVIRRNGSVVAFEPSKVAIAMTKAFIAVNGGQGAASARVREQVSRIRSNWR
jgi:ribonucleoside-diphosphate reductase alpha chain